MEAAWIIEICLRCLPLNNNNNNTNNGIPKTLHCVQSQFFEIFSRGGDPKESREAVRRPPWLQVDVGINAALGCGNVQPHSVPFIQFGVTRLNVLGKGAL